MKHDQKRGESLRDRADVSSLLCNFTNVFCDRLINNSMLFFNIGYLFITCINISFALVITEY